LILKWADPAKKISWGAPNSNGLVGGGGGGAGGGVKTLVGGSYSNYGGRHSADISAGFGAMLAGQVGQSKTYGVNE